MRYEKNGPKIRQAGITIIALIVTVIIIIILAGISLSIQDNNETIIGRAINASKISEKEENTELLEINELNEAMDSGEENYIRNDDLPENQYLKSFITEWSVKAGETVVLPIYQKQGYDEERGENENYFNYNFRVDYGDGTILNVKSFDDANRSHTYKEDGTYNIKIDGVCEAWSFDKVNYSKEMITKIVQWGVINAKHYDFAECSNITGNIPLPSKNSFRNVESFRLLFYYCNKITGKIPSDLFKYAPNVISMANVFNFTEGLEGDIPEKLFENCPKIKNFRFTFSKSGVGGQIPEDLFKNNKEAENFRGTFQNCEKLTGVLPKKLLSYSEKIKTIQILLNRTKSVKIEEILIKSKEVKDINKATFEISKGNKIILYVPINSVTETSAREGLGDVENVIIKEYK